MQRFRFFVGPKFGTGPSKDEAAGHPGELEGKMDVNQAIRENISSKKLRSIDPKTH